jgi:hypothetical protein
MVFVLKTLLAGSIIAFASWLAGKKPVLAGFVIALPMTSMLGILFAYAEHRDMDKINQFASSIFIAVPLSLTFFIPFLLNRWLKMNFALTFLAALTCLSIAYYLVAVKMKITL